MLNRRLFNRALAAAGAILPVAASQLVPSRQQGYLFDWDIKGTLQPYTNHPRYAGRLVMGRHNRTYWLNPATKQYQDLGPCTKFMTGPNGWCEYQIRFADNGTPVKGVYDQWDNDRLCYLLWALHWYSPSILIPGKWLYTDPQPRPLERGEYPIFQQKDPLRRKGDIRTDPVTKVLDAGEPIPRWREEILKQRVEGHIVYVDLRTQLPPGGLPYPKDYQPCQASSI